ncbi:hypothetical protein BDV95DRAFT_611911 [Massariosphaeria phaeospora]|uniref:L-ornithine N(5)-monooxygenase [NAD(P)H] n=1 Tax=Massariosphaeria phaeospora TaxID=100035 RepID=A0A7C8I223_9PLEO|nr:hypothetical protein BDV95DRAFT_611911 [Massariosphaeria phaeospora]
MHTRERIHYRGRGELDAVPYFPVLVIGAGASGIAWGCRLKEKLGFDQFRILDRQSGVGGTWWSATYPGVACDVPAAAYSFSWAPFNHSENIYPTGAEFVDYLQQLVDRYDIRQNIELNVEVSELRWVEADSEWETTLSYLLPGLGDLSRREREEKINFFGNDSVYIKRVKVRAKIVISCAGILVEPNPWPSSISGRETFKGDIIHSARWRKEVELDGKDIVVVGTGCSAAQIVPALLKEPYHVKSVTQIMRSTAPYMMPRMEEPFAQKKYRQNPVFGFLYRLYIYVLCELILSTVLQMKHKKWRAAIQNAMLERTFTLIPEKYHAIMTPENPYGCKRRIFDSEWLPSMHKPNFTLLKREITAVHGRKMVLGPLKVTAITESKDDGTATEINADVIVLATGYDAHRWLHPLAVYGRGGASLHNVWKERGGPHTYMSLAVDGFPNFFITTGPNSSNGHHSQLFMTENVVNYTLRMIKPILSGQVHTVEVKKDAVEKWTEGVQRDLKSTVFMACRNWYMDEEGYNTTLYPRSQTEFTLRCMFPRYGDWETVPSR